MSDTPRTDAEMPDLTFRPYTLEWQRAQQFARQLERELNEAKRGAARYEVVRKMNAVVFKNLFWRCIEMNLRFDDEVDKIGGLK